MVLSHKQQIILILCLLFIYLFNPSEQQHVKKINGKCVIENCDLFKLVRAEYRNKILFSYSESNLSGKTEVVSIGFLGVVIIVLDFSIIRTPQIF